MRKLLCALALAGAPAVSASSDEWAEAARARISRVALGNSARISGYWDPAQRDCSGFVRFVYREAIAGRPTLWLDRHGKRVDYVGADELVSYNFDAVSAKPELDSVRTGDLLVYHAPRKRAADAWHLMLVIEPPPGAPRRPLAIYHNGSTGRAAALRKVWLDELLAESAAEWRAHPQNRKFVGVFRWKGWSVDPSVWLGKGIENAHAR